MKMNLTRYLNLSNYLLKLAIVPIMLVFFSNSVYAQTIYYDTYAFRIPLTLNNASLGITTDQTNFVALVKVTSPNFVSGVCSDQTGGISSSIPVFAIIDSAYSTTQELNYQVENYNTTTGVIYFWVKIPDLYKSTSNKLYCYFGTTNPSVVHSTAWQKLTWSNVVTTAPGITYSGVWHFNENPSGSSPQFSDATVNNNNLTVGSYLGSLGSVTQNTSSQIGNGITLTATSVLDTIATAMPNTTSSQTLSLWASYPSTPPHTANLIVLENGTNPATTGNGTQLGVLLNGSATTLQTWRWANRLTPLVSSTTIPTAVTWHHYAYAYDSVANKSYLYLDGALLAGPTSNSSNKPFSGKVTMVSFGDYINNQIPSGPKIVGGQSYTGTMDESHVIGTTLTADWIKAEYVNQKNPDAFTTSGPMQTNSVRASAVAGYLVYTWKGASTDITSPSNWNNTTSGVANEVPVNGNVNWVIPAGLSHYPVLTTDTALYGLTIAAGAYINLNGHTLKVGCNIYNSSGGQIMYASSSSSKIQWDGSISAQYYYGTSTALTAELGAMEVKNSTGGTINITGGPVDIFSSLTMTKGNLVIGASPAALTLKSTATLTANVTAIPSGSSITGTVNVERYITGGANYRGYRLISSPVYLDSVSSNKVYSINYLDSYTYLTGNAGGGFDKTGNPTLYLYREDQTPSNTTFISGNFWGISAINNSTPYNYSVSGTLANVTVNDYLPVGNGVMFFFRGNRASASLAAETTPSYITPVTVTTVTSGPLNQGQVIVHDWYTPTSAYLGYTGAGTGTNQPVRGFNLVGNPYASSIDWEQYNTTTATSGIYANNVGTTIWEFDPLTHNYNTYQKGGAFTNHGSNIISSGEGFFVQASSATNPQLIFNETAKTTTENTGLKLMMDARPNFAALNNTASDQHLRIQLAADSINTDDTYIGFSSTASAKYIVNEDAPYLAGQGEVKISSFSSDSVKLAINKLPLPGVHQTVIRLFATATDYGTYKLNMTELTGIPQLYEVWLMDRFNKDSLDMRQNTTYAFDITADTNSYGNNRFQLVIRQDPALAVHLLDFTANKASNGAETVWKTENEQNYTNFTVERSTDNGATFTVLGGFASSALGTYSLLDKNPAQGTDEYRLKLEDLNGSITYSNIVTLIYGNANSSLTKTNITIYPNPAKSTLNLNITPGFKTNPATQQNLNPGIPALASTGSNVYNIKIVNSLGQVIKTATTGDQNWQTDVSGLVPGTYILQVVNNSDSSVVGKGSFIKL